MPLYNYKCVDGCGNIFEIKVRLEKLDTKDEQNIECPHCAKQGEKNMLKRQISAPAIHYP